MGTCKKGLGKSFSSILEEEITPEKVLSGNKKRAGHNLTRVEWQLYSEYLRYKESLSESPKGNSK